MELGVRGYGGISPCSSGSSAGRAGQASFVPPGERGRGFQPVPGFSAAQGTTSGTGQYDMGEMLLPLHRRDGKEGGRDDPLHGGTLTHSARLHEKATYKSAWLEYNILFRMEMAACNIVNLVLHDNWTLMM